MKNQLNEVNELMDNIKQMVSSANTDITESEIYDALKNYKVDSLLENRWIETSNYPIIHEALNYKNNHFECRYPKPDSKTKELWQSFEVVSENADKSGDYKGTLYISIVPDKIGEVSSAVIKFLIDNNITAKGEISNTYCNDSLIIYFENSNDANQVIDYIAEHFKDSLGYHQPFIPDYNGIGFVIGYNEEMNNFTKILASYLAKFVIACQKKKKINQINFDAFIKTLEDSYMNGRASNPKEILTIITSLNTIKLKNTNNN